MQVIDLTHVIRPGMPVFPGTPQVRITLANTLAEHGFEERFVAMTTHTGTHMDNPSHILEGRSGLDRVGPDRFLGPGCCVDVRGKTAIGTEELEPLESLLEQIDFLILRTGWEDKWGDPAYFSGFPCLTEAAARFLTRFQIKGVGVDAISIDRMEDEHLPVHHILLEQDILIVENLTNVAQLSAQGFTFLALPLKIEDSDGSPVRALGIVE